MRRFGGWLLAGLLASAGCGEEGGFSSQAKEAPLQAVQAADVLPAAGASGITVMTRNLYVGTAVEAFLAPSPTPLPVLVAKGYADVVASDPAGRMAKIADEIVAANPDLVGLQEADLIRIQNPGDSLSANPTPATAVAYDFVQLLVDALEARGAHYLPVIIGNEADIEAPGLTSTGYMDVRLTDRDVLLARVGVSTANPEAHHFATQLQVPIGGTLVTVERGWVEADATVGARTVHVADTHLESAYDPVQVAQSLELAGTLAAESRPVLLLGDLNSPADGSGTPSYANFLAAGFADLWVEANPRDPGLTCCNAADLLNPLPTFTERIDVALLHLPATANQDFVGGVRATVVGDDASDKTEGGLWPSDHAGVVATVRLPAGVRFADR